MGWRPGALIWLNRDMFVCRMPPDLERISDQRWKVATCVATISCSRFMTRMLVLVKGVLKGKTC